MKTRKLFLLLVLVAFGYAFTANLKAQPVANDKESARAFVQKFYDWYSALSNAEMPGKRHQLSPEQVLMRQRKKYFDDRLGNALRQYYAKPLKDDDLGLDFDPFLNAQDTGPTYHACHVVQHGNKYTVELRDLKKGKPEKDLAYADLLLMVELKKDNDHWVFTNFLYPMKAGDSSLLDLLKEQKKAS